MAFNLRTSAFAPGDFIPRRHSCEGENLSPAFEWDDPPPSTRSLALIADDPDAPAGTWTHWILWDIPAETRSLPEAFTPGLLGVSGVNDFGKPGYGGPCPPRGHGPHRYFFTLFALSIQSLGLPVTANRAALNSALSGRILAEIHLVGRYERKQTSAAPA
jgi:Raf kinase inhibitor-like YbhB/YbcL family protein